MKTLKYFNGKEVVTMKQGENFSELEFVGNDMIRLIVDDGDRILIKSSYIEIENVGSYLTNEDIMSDDFGFGG